MPYEAGKLLAQAVFLECYRRYPERICFDSNGHECDFLLGEWDSIQMAIQVTDSLSDPKVKKRELRGLVAACKKFNLSKGIIITRYEEDQFLAGDIKVDVVPAWKMQN